MGLLKLYCDVSAKKLVKGLTDSSSFTLPPFYFGDMVSIEVYLVSPNPRGGQGAPLSRIDTAAYSLRVGIGSKGSSPDAIQDTWAKYTGAEPRWEGYLNVGTTNLETALGAADSINRFLEVEIFSAEGGYETIAQQAVTVHAQVMPAGAATPIPADQYVTQAQMLQLFVQWINAPGRTITLTSANNLYTREIGVNDDGSAMDNLGDA